MRLRAQIALAALMILSGCAGGEGDLQGTPKLSEACQLRACECVGKGFSLIVFEKKAPVLWHENGDAYCPEGFKLVITE